MGTLTELAPKYLSNIPTDPFSVGSFHYRPQGTNWLLYSVGVDKVDDGGEPVIKTSKGVPPTGDLFFNSPW